ncbi:MAG: hypothetical protein V3V61_07780 [Gammaproteobacteria bacterium]
MQTSFDEMITTLVNEGVCCLSDLEPMDERRLAAALMRDSDTQVQWEFINEPASNDNLPNLLIDLLESRRNGILNLIPPENSLVITMAQSAIEWSKPRILHAIQKEMNTHLSCGEE